MPTANVHFCPRCHKSVARLEYPDSLVPQWDCDDLLSIEDAEVEDWIEARAKRVVRVLTAPAWRTAIMSYEGSMSRVSFGCPWCGKGKIILGGKDAS